MKILIKSLILYINKLLKYSDFSEKVSFCEINMYIFFFYVNNRYHLDLQNKCLALVRLKGSGSGQDLALALLRWFKYKDG